LLLAFPLAFIGLIAIACVFLCITYKLQRSKLNVYSQPKLPD
jgi:hypothetical protein